MVIFTPPDITDARVRAKLASLAAALKAESCPYSAELMAGAHWHAAIKAKDENAGDEEKEGKSAKDLTAPLIEAATWSVLSPTGEDCAPPKDWLAHENARIAAGSVIVPPVTEAVLDYWSATTEPRSPRLSPHPFLYGLSDDDEGTPLVGVAFRLEVEALRGAPDYEDMEASDAAADVEEIFNHFPPLRAELHHIKLSVVRDWLVSEQGTKHPLVYRARDKWRAKPADESAGAAAAAIGPNGTLILPATVLVRELQKDLLKDSEQAEGKDTTISDVLNGISNPKRHARYLRTITPVVGLTGENDAWRWDAEAPQSEMSPKIPTIDGFKKRLEKELIIGGINYTFRYYRPHRSNEHLQYLDNHETIPGHIARAEGEAARLAEAIAPGDRFLRLLLSAGAHHHDEGKRFPKWQRAFGWHNGMRELAKLHPALEKPAPLNGFRHEWESLRQLMTKGATPPPDLPPETQALWRDLLLHLVGVHHGHLRPSITDDGLTPTTEAERQNPPRLEAAERFIGLQHQLGRWRLAYFEALLKTADAEGSRVIREEEDDGN